MSNHLVPVQDVERMATIVAKSGLFGIKTIEQAAALMLIAQSEGLHPATAAQEYDIIQGRPARKTHSVLARFQAAGGSVQWHDFTESVVSGTFSHPQGGSLKVEWTIEMARRAGLAGKDNWKNMPRAMLRARCIAEGVRAVYPAAIGGNLIREEAEDLRPTAAAPQQPSEPKNMGAAEIVVDLLPVLDSIKNATTVEALEALRPDIRRLRGDDKQKAMQAAKERAEQIRTGLQNDGIDPATGEVLPAPAGEI